MYEEEDQVISIALHETGIVRFTQNEVNGRNTATVIAKHEHVAKAIVNVYEHLGNDYESERFTTVFTSFGSTSIDVHEDEDELSRRRYLTIRTTDRYGHIVKIRMFGMDLEALSNAIEVERMSRVPVPGADHV